MTRRMSVLLSISLLTLALAAAPTWAEETGMMEESASEQTSASLTAQQKAELAELYQALFAKKKQLIAKYAEFGVISQDKANRWNDRLDAHYEKLKQNDFIPNEHKCSRKDRDSEQRKEKSSR